MNNGSGPKVKIGIRMQREITLLISSLTMELHCDPTVPLVGTACPT